MNDKADIVIPLLSASEQLLRVSRDTGSVPIYQIIDSIDRHVILTYGINIDDLLPADADGVYQIIFDYRNEEVTISECLNQLAEFATLHSGGGRDA